MKHALLLLALFAGYAALERGNIASVPYGYDEADYMYAVSLGPAANYTDTPTLGIADFFRIGLARGKDAGGRSALSESIRNSDDVVFYRHWHGPLFFDYLLALGPFHLDEHAMRAAMVVFPILTALALYFGCVWLFGAELGSTAGILSSALFLWSFATVRTTELAPHALFVLLYLCALLLLAKTVASGDRRHWYLAAAASALAFAVLEVSFVLIAVLVVCAYVERRSLRTDWRFLLRSALLFIGVVLAVWPAAILKLSFLKAYVFMAYLALFRKSPWGHVGLFETWRHRFAESPIEWALIGAGLLLYFIRGRKPLYPTVLYAALMILAVLRVTTDYARYLLPFLPALHLIAGCMIAAELVRFRSSVRYAVIILLCAGIFWNTRLQLARIPTAPEERAAALLSFIRRNGWERKRMLAPQADIPQIHYYFPQAHLRGYEGDQPNDAERRDFDAVLYPGYPVRSEAVR